MPGAAVESRWVAPDGHPIRRIDWPEPDGPPRGSMLFLPGRGDAYEKYLETFEHWRQRGWRVTAADWRGQAGSGRLGADAVTGHVDDFALWIGDLAALVARMGSRARGPAGARRPFDGRPPRAARDGRARARAAPRRAGPVRADARRPAGTRAGLRSGTASPAGCARSAIRGARAGNGASAPAKSRVSARRC